MSCTANSCSSCVNSRLTGAIETCQWCKSSGTCYNFFDTQQCSDPVLSSSFCPGTDDFISSAGDVVGTLAAIFFVIAIVGCVCRRRRRRRVFYQQQQDLVTNSNIAHGTTNYAPMGNTMPVVVQQQPLSNSGYPMPSVTATSYAQQPVVAAYLPSQPPMAIAIPTQQQPVMAVPVQR